jgi:hypothetical protein
MTLDDLRARFPGLGFALYALNPYEAVQCEAHFADGTYLTFSAWSAEEAVRLCAEALLPPQETPPEEEDIFA